MEKGNETYNQPTLLHTSATPNQIQQESIQKDDAHVEPSISLADLQIFR